MPNTEEFLNKKSPGKNNSADLTVTDIENDGHRVRVWPNKTNRNNK